VSAITVRWAAGLVKPLVLGVCEVETLRGRVVGTRERASALKLLVVTELSRWRPRPCQVEVATNHVAMVSHPDEVLQLIKTAAEAVATAT
jgi:hypothetical protein